MKFKKVTISDFSNWQAGRDRNGGAYGYWTTYFPAGGGKYVARYECTSEFETCAHCGNYNCNCGRPQLVTEEELLQLIIGAEQDSNDNVTVEVVLNDAPDYIKTIRRRAEDALRKGSEENVFKVAALLGVNLA